MNREKTLDYLRGLALFQVVFVHLIYWLGVIRAESLTIVKSFALFEMPILFFVTGAVNSVKDYQSNKLFYIKRIKGILIPYYIYAAICMAMAVVYYLKTGAFTIALVLQLVLSWLIPINTQIMPFPFFTGALWFIPVYLMSIVLFPHVKKAVQRFGRISIAFLALFFIVVEIVFSVSIKQVPSACGAGTYIGKLSHFMLQSSFYMIFMGIGVLYSQFKKREKRDLIMSLSVLAVSMAGLCVSSVLLGQTLNMQMNKFPPNHVFLFYSFAFMTILYLAFPLIKKLYRMLVKAIPLTDKLFASFSENSITVFLYQSFAFWVTNFILCNLHLKKTVYEPFVAIFLVYPLVCIAIKLATLVTSFWKALTNSNRPRVSAPPVP